MTRTNQQKLHNTKKFGGKCYNCGETCHKGSYCPNEKKGNQKDNGRAKFNGNGNLCGKKGHKEVDCWANPEKRQMPKEL